MKETSTLVLQLKSLLTHDTHYRDFLPKYSHERDFLPSILIKETSYTGHQLKRHTQDTN